MVASTGISSLQAMQNFFPAGGLLLRKPVMPLVSADQDEFFWSRILHRQGRSESRDCEIRRLLVESQRDPERLIQLSELGPGKGPYELRQVGFGQASEVVADNPAFMFEALTGNSGRESTAVRKN